MKTPQLFVSTQSIVDAIIDSATLVEAERIAPLAQQGLEDPASLTPVQARHVFAAFLLLFDPTIILRGETVPSNMLSFARLPATQSCQAAVPGGLS